MPKAYWIAHVTVTDPDRYPDYVKANRIAFENFGARFLVRGGAYEVLEGDARDRHVVIEFDDYETALACYNSPEYRAAKAIRDLCATTDLVIVRGYE